MKIIRPTITDPIALISTMPAETSLATFADFLCSLVIRSVIDSRAVLTISAVNINKIVNEMINHSILVIWKKNPADITNNPKKP